MRIQELTAYHVRIPLRWKVKHASHSRTLNDTLIVRCRLEDGTEGWGEGLPRTYVTGETIDSAMIQFQESGLSSQLGGKIDAFETLIPTCEQLQLANTPADARDCFGNIVRCAIELSILDAFTKHWEVPLSAVTSAMSSTREIAREVHEPKKSVNYSVVMTGMKTWKEVAVWMALRWMKFPQCKVKVGIEGKNDVATLTRMRKYLGKQTTLRIDANEAWTCQNLAAKLEPLAPFHVASVEQPVPHAEVMGLSAIRNEISVPVMLDESLCSMGDARRAVDNNLCDIFNLRLSKCGGFLSTLRLAALAREHQLQSQLGCQVGETGILTAAGRHFACSVGGLCNLEGSYDRYLVKETLTKEDLSFKRRGFAPALTGHGLGITVDETALKRVTVTAHSLSFK